MTDPRPHPNDAQLLRAAADQAEARAQHWAGRVRVFRQALARLAQGGAVVDLPPGVLDAAHRTLGYPMPTTVTREGDPR